MTAAPARRRPRPGAPWPLLVAPMMASMALLLLGVDFGLLGGLHRSRGGRLGGGRAEMMDDGGPAVVMGSRQNNGRRDMRDVVPPASEILFPSDSESSASSTTTYSYDLALPTYTPEMASRAVRKAEWTCGDYPDPLQFDDRSSTAARPFFAFVHVYKAAGSTLRRFFAEYSALCRKSLALVVNCSGVKPKILKSADEDEHWNDCRLKMVMDHRRRILEHDAMEGRAYEGVSNGMLRRNFDVLAGHYRMGCTDNVFSGNDEADAFGAKEVGEGGSGVRHVVFLREPEERYVSSLLYQAKRHGKNKKETVRDTAEFVKRRVREAVSKGEEWEGLFNYLLTPAQVPRANEEKASMEARAGLAMRNLVHYNAIVGMTGRFDESMEILRHVLMPEEFAGEDREERLAEMFDGYAPKSKDGQEKEEEEEETRARQNVSNRGEISTSSVLAELEADVDFMKEYRRFFKAERTVVDFAREMHRMQYASVLEAKAAETPKAVVAPP